MIVRAKLSLFENSAVESIMRKLSLHRRSMAIDYDMTQTRTIYHKGRDSYQADSRYIKQRVIP